LFDDDEKGSVFWIDWLEPREWGEREKKKERKYGN
jgi:hypothetical protein